MNENPCSDGYFVRLGSRSPKDTVLMENEGLRCFDRMKSMLESYLHVFYVKKECRLENDIDSIPNQEISFLSKATTYSLRISNSSDAMEMLLHSERVYSDLLLYLDFKDLYQQQPIKMIIRKWNQDLPNRNEFRCFVSNNQMTGATQYYNNVYYAKLDRQKDTVRTLLREYFDTKISRIFKEMGYTTYTIDIGILKTNMKPIVIELNSSDVTNDWSKRGTGSGCFCWRKDAKVLEEGPYEFRMIQKPQVVDMKNMNAPWVHLIRNARNKVLMKEKEMMLKESSDGGCTVL